MVVDRLVLQVLRDEALTRGLGDAEARVLIEWLSEQAENLGQNADANEGEEQLRILVRKARGIARFVALWFTPGTTGAAHQLAAVERFEWPLPDGTEDPWELMYRVLAWETTQLRQKDGWVTSRQAASA